MTKPCRTNFALLILFLLPLYASAQNWRPVSISEMYHYRQVDSSHITHTMRIDSARLVGADSVFYLNRVLARYGVAGNYTLLRNQGQFLGQEMTVAPDGTVTFFAQNLFGDTTIVIKTQAGPNDSWIAGGNLSAIVSGVAEGVVLGVEDSLKTITFSNGAVWILSKNHGLVQAIDPLSGDTLELAGLELANQGLQLFDFSDIFAFQPGDVLEYQTNFSSLGTATETRTKRYILEANVGSDTAHYVVRELRRTTVADPAPQTTETELITDWIFYRSDWERISAYDRQLVQIAPLTDIYLLARLFADGVTLGDDTLDISAANCGVLRPAPDTALAALDVMECVNGLRYFEDFRKNLGRVRYVSIGQDQNIVERLVGALIAGDTIIGALTPDDELVNAGEPSAAPALSIFPNPTTGLFYLRTGSPISVEIYGVGGRLFKTFQATTVLDLSAAPAGLYLLKIKWPQGGVTWGKVEKQ